MKLPELNFLINITINFLRDEKINPNNMELMKKISRNENSVFSSICSQIFGEVNYNKVLQLRQMWIRDTNGIINFETKNFKFLLFLCLKDIVIKSLKILKITTTQLIQSKII